MIKFESVTKNYGKTTALTELSLDIEQPGIYCLLGRNGAGKTTMLKTIAGHTATTSGSVQVNGKTVGMLAMPDDVHFVETGAMQFNMRLEALFKAAAEINPDFDTGFALKMARSFDLDVKKKFKQLSFGMKAMVNTLTALSSGKDIILLDEPVLGFDPVMRSTFYRLVQKSMESKEKTVIVSTHIIDEIAKVAEKLIIIDKGRLKLYCDMNEIDEKAYCVTGIMENVNAATEGLHILSETKAGGFISRYVYDRRIDESDKYSITALSLQDFFIGLVGGEMEVDTI